MNCRIGFALLSFSILLAHVAGCRKDLRKPFSQKCWIVAEAEGRGSMVSDLLSISPGVWRVSDNLLANQPRFKGKKKAAIVLLLGTPDEDCDVGISSSDGDCASFISYNVGKLNERGDMQANFYLMIGFDKSGVVSKISICD